MIPVSEFAATKGITEDKAVEMIKEGFYSGRLIDGRWFVSPEEVGEHVGSSTSSQEGPALSVIFYIFGALSVIGGVLLCLQLWPAYTGARYVEGLHYPAIQE